jgi:hypothetical protein
MVSVGGYYVPVILVRIAFILCDKCLSLPVCSPIVLPQPTWSTTHMCGGISMEGSKLYVK